MKPLTFARTTHILAGLFSSLTFIYMFRYGFSYLDFFINIILLATTLLFSRDLLRVITPYLLYGFVALHIHQAYGDTMIHFEVFILLACTTIYNDWKIVFHCLVAAAVHHLLFTIFNLIPRQECLSFLLVVRLLWPSSIACTQSFKRVCLSMVVFH